MHIMTAILEKRLAAASIAMLLVALKFSAAPAFQAEPSADPRFEALAA